MNTPTVEYPGNLLTVPFMTTEPTEGPIGASSRLSTLTSGYVLLYNFGGGDWRSTHQGLRREDTH